MSQHVKGTVFEETPSLNFNLTTWQSYQAFAKKKASSRYVSWVGIKWNCPFRSGQQFLILTGIRELLGRQNAPRCNFFYNKKHRPFISLTVLSCISGASSMIITANTFSWKPPKRTCMA